MTAVPAVDATPTRPALRYHGGKWRLAPWIIAHFPAHVCYVEPFGGSAAVLLQKPPASSEVYNDLEGDLVNFFRVLRERPDALIEAIRWTPYACAELERAFVEAPEDALERARLFYVLCWQQRMPSKAQWRGGWRFCVASARNPVDQWNRTEHLYQVAERLKLVQIEHDTALHTVERFDHPDTLFYCDPPYVWSTRSERWRGRAYVHEMDDGAHREMAEALHAAEGMVVVSGYPSPLYDELFAGWRTVDLSGRNGLAKTTTERLWLSPRTWARLEAERLEAEQREAERLAEAHQEEHTPQQMCLGLLPDAQSIETGTDPKGVADVYTT